MHTAIEHLRAVKEELGPFAEWYDLGLNLGLSANLLDVIKKDAGSTGDQVQAVLCDWLRQNYNVQQYGLPSWKMLVNAVQPINGALARNIRDRLLIKCMCVYVCVCLCIVLYMSCCC